ncbi:hypothetical protein [Flavobacterium sp.]|uniref:hypothetical protein n=1 Tax=Flavobacterium sp. TaxID=239 RepID=UPI0039E350BA
MNHWFFSALLLMGCANKEQTTNAPTAIPIENTTPEENTAISSDKDSLSFDISDNNAIDAIQIVPLDSPSEDQHHYEIRFFSKGRQFGTYTAHTQTGREVGEWSVNTDLMSNGKQTDARFLHCSYGVPACGYDHAEFLFFLDSGKVQLVSRWSSASDGGFGYWTDIIPQFSDGKAVSFSSRKVEVADDEAVSDATDALEISYSDSAVYHFETGKWRGRNLTPQGKIYRKENKLFDAFYKPEK